MVHETGLTSDTSLFSRNHCFTLQLDGADNATLEIADALYEAGCDDATIYSRDGVLWAAFDREAPTPAEAIASAIRDVETTGLFVIRVVTN